MAEKKSILEEALLDIKNIQNALNANTKEILRSVAKEEIDSVVKESLEEATYEEEEVDALAPMGTEVEDEDEFNADSDIEDVDSEFGDEELPAMGAMGMDDEESSEELDMTGASDEDVIAIYKKLSGEDEIEIVGDEVHLSVTEPGEYVIKLDSLKGGADMDVDSEIEPIELGGDDEEDDVEYDIEMGDDEEESEEEESEFGDEEEESDEEEEEESDEEEEEEEEIEENMQHTLKNGRMISVKPNNFPDELKREGIKETIKAKQIVSETAKKYNSLLTEAKKLKGENEEFRTALKEFRTKLVETVVFNSNLTYITRLFTEHSTTKAEKQSILKRFDDISNLKESKKLHKTIAVELENRKPISESVESKIIKEATTSISKQLNESTAYVDPSTKRIMDLINRVEKR